MARNFFVKVDQYDPSSWKEVTNLFVKKTATVWTAVNDAWVKVSPTTWKRFWQSATNPDSPIEILTSYNSNEELRLQGVNYHWTPSPQTLTYRFLFIDENQATVILKDTTTTTNPASGTSSTLPTSTTYQTISRTNFNHFTIGGNSTYQFEVRGTSVSGTLVTQKAEFNLRTPKAPTVTVEKVTNTSVKLTITSASSDDYFATGRYIVYTYDAVGGVIESGGGRGGYAADVDPKIVTITGLTAGRQYDFYVAPYTGTSGSTTANATGYPGIEAMETFATDAPYSFSFGNVLHVGTNGYVSLTNGNSSDSITATTGKVIGIVPGDLQQSTATSIWYWSNDTEFRIRWEGYHFGNSSNIREYEIIFYKDQSYVQVFGITVDNSVEGIQAFVKDGTVLTSYPTAVVAGARYIVSLDEATAPLIQAGPYVAKSKAVMKQVTGLSSGSTDIGYTSITTSINQNVTPTLGAFDIATFSKGSVNSSAQGATRSTTLTWNASTNATKYKILYEGSSDNINWTTVQTYTQSAYKYALEDLRSWTTPSGGDFTFYNYMRAKIRAEGDNGEATVISNGDVYVYAAGTAPGSPTFGTITKTNVSASIPITTSSSGSNYLYPQVEYMFRSDSGTYPASWSTQTIASGATTATISLSSLSGNTKYWIKIRIRNYDELYSTENETNFTTNDTAVAPNQLTATSNSSDYVTLTWAGGSGTYYEFFYGSQATTAPSSVADFGTAGTITSSPYNFLAPRGFDYYYFVRAVLGTTTNNVKSGWYPTAAPGVKGRRLLYPPPTPNTPTSSGITTTNITVSWTAGTNGASNDTATSYEVYTSTSATAPTSSTSGTAYTSPKSFTYTASTSPTKQYFWVRGVTEGGNSAWSSVLEATPTALNPPGPVSSIAGTATASSIDWTWSAPTTGGTPTDYEWALTTNTTAPTSYTALGSTTRTKTTGSLTASTTYYLWVRAKNADGTSTSERNATAVTTLAAGTYTATASGSRGYNSFSIAYTLTNDTKSVVIVYGTSTSYGTSVGTYTSSGTATPVGPLGAATTYFWKVTPYSNTNGTGTAGTPVTGSTTTYTSPAHTGATPATPTFQRFTSGNNSYIRYGWNNQSTLTPTGDYASWGYEFRVYSNVTLTTQLAGSPFTVDFKTSTDLRTINNLTRVYVFSGEGSGTPYVGDFTYTTAAVYGRYRPYYVAHGSSTKVYTGSVFSAAI